MRTRARNVEGEATRVFHTIGASVGEGEGVQ